MRVTSRPKVTGGETPETDAKAQHPVAYLERQRARRGKEKHMEQNLPFDLDALLVFGKVVESRSLSKAAALLGMPKSTVSRKLTKLEADLGIKLLRKNTHQLTVTDLGQKVYGHAVHILAEANGVRALAEGRGRDPRANSRVAFRFSSALDSGSGVGAPFFSPSPTR